MAEQTTYHSTEVSTELSQPNFVLTSEIIKSAVDANHGHSSHKLIHPDFPEIYIRRLRPEVIKQSRRVGHPKLEKSSSSIEDIREEYRDAYARLASYGIEVVPFKLVEEAGEIVILTQKVHGFPIEDILEHSTPRMIESLDNTLSAEVDYLKSISMQDNGKYPEDAPGTIQLMYGHYYGETSADDRVIFVDIDPGDESLQPVQNLRDPRFLLLELGLLVQDTLNAEAANTQNKLPSVRAKLASGIISIQTSSINKEDISNSQLLLEALKTGDISPALDFLEAM
jgi:hypothetical protein